MSEIYLNPNNEEINIRENWEIMKSPVIKFSYDSPDTGKVEFTLDGEMSWPQVLGIFQRFILSCGYVIDAYEQFALVDPSGNVVRYAVTSSEEAAEQINNILNQS
jgi:hypothetical protein